ncbi:MAG TPA: hypothetical protein VFF65_12090 [Phycisphaerales bacterium]|nr:hypothetical protein [Phycisphaerales bacterium]
MPETTLDTDNRRQLCRALDHDDKLLNVEGARLQLTKGEAGHKQIALARDRHMEKRAQLYLSDRLGMDKLLQRARDRGAPFSSKQLPHHYVARLLYASDPTIEQNSFMLIPQIYGVQPEGSEKFRAIEIIDNAEAAGSQIIFPAIHRLCDLDTRRFVATDLMPVHLELYTLWGWCHELGHWTGPFRIAPERDPQLRITQSFIDHLGEADTDSLAAELTPEIPEIAVLMILTRIFSWSRRGFVNNPESGLTNSDNDAWVGTAMFRRALASGGIALDGHGKVHLDVPSLCQMTRGLHRDLQVLGQHLMGECAAVQNALVCDWMRSEVECTAGQFRLPELQRHLYEQLGDLPEYPHVRAPLSDAE